jgi:hypothetical protein
MIALPAVNSQLHGFLEGMLSYCIASSPSSSNPARPETLTEQTDIAKYVGSLEAERGEMSSLPMHLCAPLIARLRLALPCANATARALGWQRPHTSEQVGHNGSLELLLVTMWNSRTESRAISEVLSRKAFGKRSRSIVDMRSRPERTPRT